MRDNQASSTSDMVTVIRALHQHNEHSPVLSDPLAYDLMPKRWQKLFARPKLLAYTVWLTSYLRRVHANVISRARYCEDQLELMLSEGDVQYVIVGAGMDSFAYRHEHSSQLTIFEIDHPNTQALKQKRLAALNKEQPDNLEYLSIDFELQKISEVLLASERFDPNKKTLFCWMGVTYYLHEETVFKAIDDISHVTLGNSRLIFDYLLDESPGGRKDKTAIAMIKRITAFKGEPILTCFSHRKLPFLLASKGFNVLHHLSGDDLTQRYYQQSPTKDTPSNLFQIIDVAL